MSNPFQSLPQRAQIWHGSQRPQGPDRRLAWIDEDGQVRSLLYLPGSDPAPDAVWASLTAAMLKPREGRPCRPVLATFPDPEVVTALQERARKAGLSLVHQSDAPPALLRAPASTLTCVGVPSTLMAEFFETAASFTLAAPWLAWQPGDRLLLQGLESQPLLATLLGVDDEPPGLALFRTEDALRSFEQERDDAGLLAWLSLEPPTAVGPQLMAEIAENGWTLVTFNHVPLALGPGGRLATAEEIRLLLQAMEAVERFSEADRPTESLVLSDGTPVTLRLRTPAAA